MQNLEHFRQSSLLRKIPNALFQPSPSDKRSQGLCSDKQSRSSVIFKPKRAFVISQSLTSVYYNKGSAQFIITKPGFVYVEGSVENGH